MQDDLTLAAIGHKMAVGGGGSALVFGGLAISDWAAIAGVLIAAIGLGLQIYYKRRADRREAELQAAQLERLKRG